MNRDELIAELKPSLVQRQIVNGKEFFHIGLLILDRAEIQEFLDSGELRLYETDGNSEWYIFEAKR